MILGLRTALYPAPDLAKSKAFYAKVLGVEPGLVPDSIAGNVFSLIENPHFDPAKLK